MAGFVYSSAWVGSVKWIWDKLFITDLIISQDRSFKAQCVSYGSIQG